MTKNTFKCPNKLWNKLSNEDKEEYNRCMELSDYDEWFIVSGEPIKDRKIVAHNFLITVLKSFNK